MTDLGWGPSLGENPFPPANVQVVSPLFTGALDIRWDDPRINPCNSAFDIVGVNIYRSDTTERGPYTRINRFPVGANFYRDMTDNAFAEQETVLWPQDYISRGESANGSRFTFKTKRCPIVKKDGQAITANSPADVQVTINGVIVPVHEVFGTTGEITLINTQTFDMVLRMDVLFNRNQSLELYAQPFLTVGHYSNPRELATADSYDLVAYEENGVDAKSVDYARLVAVLIEAVKEQQEQIELSKQTLELANI